MKLTRHILTGLAGWLLLSANARADEAAAPENPYGTIITRNVFGLVPIPTNPPADLTPAVPPPKITPNGIMDIFGKLQALFKVAVPPQAGQPPHDQSYVLAEGEQQDEIEVTKIDKVAGVVTFNNHGTVQELPLIVGVASGGADVGGAPGVPGNAAGRPVGLSLGANNVAGAGRFGRNPNLRGNPSAPGSGGAPDFGASGLSGNNGAQAEENLSPEAQVMMIEKNRLDTQEAVDKGLLPPLPPTPLTPADATSVNGEPLIAPSIPATEKK